MLFFSYLRSARSDWLYTPLLGMSALINDLSSASTAASISAIDDASDNASTSYSVDDND